MCMTVQGAAGKPSQITVMGRTADIYWPNNYNEANPDGYPVIFSLHSLGNSASGVGKWFGTIAAACASGPGCIVVVPYGTQDPFNGDLFWNASDPCCDFNNIGPDDTGYLYALANVVFGIANVDRRFVIWAGYSNGGYMGNTLARCHPDVVSHLLCYAGGGLDATRDIGSPGSPNIKTDAHFCPFTAGLFYLHAHGSADSVIVEPGDPGPGNTVGGDTAVGPYLGAPDSCLRVVAANGGTGPLSIVGGSQDFTAGIGGSETEVYEPASQGSGGHVTYLRIVGGGHVQGMNTAFTRFTQNWIWSKPRLVA
jgi:polyhydroxybutyrate depolymerase